MTLDEFKRIAKMIDDAPKADYLPTLDELQHIQELCEGVLNDGDVIYETIQESMDNIE